VRKRYCSIEEPFSANKMFVPIARGKLVKSKKYNNWIEKNLPILTEELEPAKTFPIELEFVVYSNYDWHNKNDIDNCIKPIVDLLVRAKIIPDDSTKYVSNVNIRHVWMTGKPLMSISYYEVEN
jgi:Holliday junction resolvase RusA-like endonuclease